MWQQLLEQVQKGDARMLARAISFIENEQEGADALLKNLPPATAKMIGITGPPGAGKSTLVDQLIRVMVKEGLRVAVLCVDPSSPFNLGAVLGDRIRMSEWYVHPSVFIRSLASRGSMGGLHPRIIEISELVKAAGYDYVIVETVGVGQSEIEIAGLADATVVVLVPEGGDEIQTMKAGLMEIADIFVVNKSDRPEADTYVKNLRHMLAPAFHSKEVPVLKTIAHEGVGVEALYAEIKQYISDEHYNERKVWLLTERVYFLLQQARMRDVQKTALSAQIRQQLNDGSFNLQAFTHAYLDRKNK
jgi:LAO/AO transport system kinase